MKPISIILIVMAFLGIAVTAAYIYTGDKASAPMTLSSAGHQHTTLCESDMVWVSLPEALERIQEYGDKQWRGINTQLNGHLGRDNAEQKFADSRFITFPMDSIKKFICKVEQMVAENGNKKEDGSPIRPGDLGIRFYYAAYPGLTPADIPNQTFKGRHSLLLVPTYLNTRNTYVEFFPAYVSGSGVPMPLGNIYKAQQPGKPVTLMLLNEQDVAKNQGTLCPPPDPCNAELLSMTRQ
ncbi:MAG TPA: hypothetical protein VGD17_09655 [Chitinophagaceae bacterium]